MFNYFKMKQNEWKVKSMLYTAFFKIIDNQKDIMDLCKKMFIALKDVPEIELREAFIKELASIIHEESKNDKE